jgi:hypothetical protein
MKRKAGIRQKSADAICAGKTSRQMQSDARLVLSEVEWIDNHLGVRNVFADT